jgi:ribosomal protein L11 methyltransferase
VPRATGDASSLAARHERISVQGGTPELLERAAAEAFEAGALGIEEQDGPPPLLWIYVRAADAGRVRAALLPLPALVLGPAEPIAERAWSEAWKEGLEAIVISPRLLVRPSFRAAPVGFAGRELVIEPGQAFGTGGHASTRLALEAIAALPTEALRGARVLDVGCGSGVLAIAAAKLGFDPVCAVDLDPQAIEATRRNAEVNGVSLETQLGDALSDPLAAAETAVVNVAVDLDRRIAERLDCRRLITSGYLVSEVPDLPGYHRESRREAEGWAADLHTRTQ